MAFDSIDIAAITRQQDFSIIKHNEDMKPVTDQINLGQQNQRESDRQAIDVVQASAVEKSRTEADAGKKGKNEYAGDGGKNRQKKPEAREKMVVNPHQGFDIKI
ncbi:MAG: hypothetical protein K6D96_11015 [Acetatifactor sp.]|nr:hypothetical protein [Acetatifactor sp.]